MARQEVIHSVDRVGKIIRKRLGDGSSIFDIHLPPLPGMHDQDYILACTGEVEAIELLDKIEKFTT